MPDWSKIERKFTVNGVDYPSFREAQRALANESRVKVTPRLRDAMHAAAPHVAPEALDRMAEALAAKFSFSDRSAFAEAARRRRAAKKGETAAPPQAPSVAA